MPRPRQSQTSQRLRRRYAWLPRGKICIRAVHHIFHRELEKEEQDDDSEWIHVCLTTVES